MRRSSIVRHLYCRRLASTASRFACFEPRFMLLPNCGPKLKSKLSHRAVRSGECRLQVGRRIKTAAQLEEINPVYGACTKQKNWLNLIGSTPTSLFD